MRSPKRGPKLTANVAIAVAVGLAVLALAFLLLASPGGCSDESRRAETPQGHAGARPPDGLLLEACIERFIAGKREDPKLKYLEVSLEGSLEGGWGKGPGEAWCLGRWSITGAPGQYYAFWMPNDLTFVRLMMVKRGDSYEVADFSLGQI